MIEQISIALREDMWLYICVATMKAGKNNSDEIVLANVTKAALAPNASCRGLRNAVMQMVATH